MKRIAIIGGGISGLAAAYALEQQRSVGVPIHYTLFESSPRLGGVLLTERVDGCIVEAGPDSFLSEKPWAADLCRNLGLGDQLIGSNDAERKTYILVKGKLEVMPDGLMFMVPTRILPTVLSPIFSVRTKLRMAREWFAPPRRQNSDESVAAFVQRHYGAEMVDRIADPLLSGIYGGEASQLSLRAVLPRFAEMEAKHGSLGRAMLSARKKMAAATTGTPRPLFTSLKEGMQQMVDALTSAVPPSSIRLGAKVQALCRQDAIWMISVGNAPEVFDAIILAVPALTAATLLQPVDSILALELAAIPYSSSVTVALGFDRKVRALLPPGFGFLVPRSERRSMLAVTFVHNKFPHRAPDNRALLRCFLGGSQGEGVVQMSDEQILRIVRDELREILRVNAEPQFTRIYRWSSAMAQYTLGHLDRLKRIELGLKNVPGVFLAGNGYSGIGVPDCVRSGQNAAAQALLALGSPTYGP